jgi:hypothetical protein
MAETSHRGVHHGAWKCWSYRYVNNAGIFAGSRVPYNQASLSNHAWPGDFWVEVGLCTSQLPDILHWVSFSPWSWLTDNDHLPTHSSPAYLVKQVSRSSSKLPYSSWLRSVCTWDPPQKTSKGADLWIWSSITMNPSNNLIYREINLFADIVKKTLALEWNANSNWVWGYAPVNPACGSLKQDNQ